eukprot:6176815-Pleurochrysis_carterae.AAC.1
MANLLTTQCAGKFSSVSVATDLRVVCTALRFAAPKGAPFKLAQLDKIAALSVPTSKVTIAQNLMYDSRFATTDINPDTARQSAIILLFKRPNVVILAVSTYVEN